ncbi:insulin-like growth factor-binding protein complex acid labile subunit [Caerostris extrusa]|uniref:Insulin-like growth factor-binding protein complex acid labile subunit n=1 Tax=Caerostris extrusa TaxID=172846 RepID=A0AAV4UAX4_CAEEX|nr:insulin-like growth factor-binding protein complex acid labile subunit [Caerostris extrusa]
MLRSITIAVSHLRHFENLTLDHNIGINRIFESEIQSLNNTRLKKFSLFNSTVNNIEQGAFKHLPFLTVLDLSNNYMGNEALLNVTSGVKGLALKYFRLQALVRLNTFPSESLVPLQNTSIFRLDLSLNYFTKLTNLPYIPSLKSLWLTQCNIENIDEGAFDKLPNLEELDLDSNGLFINPLIRTSWYIRYWIFHVKAKARKTINLDNDKEQSYTYDAFVSYNSRDNYWIAQHLIPALELEDPRYKLCVHERDFILGQLITENILESIEASRNVILVLTEDFIKKLCLERNTLEMKHNRKRECLKSTRISSFINTSVIKRLDSPTKGQS